MKSTMKSKPDSEEFYNDKEGVIVAAIFLRDGKEILFGDIRYLPAPHGEGHGTLEHRPVEHIGLLPRID
jgi:hypothetical protein